MQYNPTYTKAPGDVAFRLYHIQQSPVPIEWNGETALSLTQGDASLIVQTDGLTHTDTQGGQYFYWFPVRSVEYTGTVERFATLENAVFGNALSDPYEKKIWESKRVLEEYLMQNPLNSSVFGDEMRAYAVTSEKQALLTSELMLAQNAAAAGISYTPKWNASGSPCTDWTVEELSALAFQISAYVKPLIAHQQELEILIRACESEEELAAIVIDYTSVYTEV